jgi:hypothetical protein
MRDVEAFRREADLEWMITRPSGLFDAPYVSEYEQHEDQAPGIFTGRAGRAASLLAQAGGDRFVRTAVAVTTTQCGPVPDAAPGGPSAGK